MNAALFSLLPPPVARLLSQIEANDDSIISVSALVFVVIIALLSFLYVSGHIRGYPRGAPRGAPTSSRQSNSGSSIAPFDTLVIGPAGSGKTTLLHAITRGSAMNPSTVTTLKPTPYELNGKILLDYPGHPRLSQDLPYYINVAAKGGKAAH